MEALLEEIERLEKETEGKPFIEETQEVETPEPEEVEQEAAAPEVEEEETEAVTEESAPEVKAGEESEEEKAKKAQEAYRERQRLKKEDADRKTKEAQEAAAAQAQREELLKQQAEASTASEDDVLAQKLNQLDEIIRRDQFNNWKTNAEIQLESLESEFKVAFTDYDDLVSEAMELAKITNMADGLTESQALAKIKMDKLLVAERAAQRKEDPVEAVYKEAKALRDKFNLVAEKLGYQKTNAPKPKTMTQKAALREASKPNAVNGGKNAGALKLSYEEMDDVSDLTIGQMMSGNY